MISIWGNGVEAHAERICRKAGWTSVGAGLKLLLMPRLQSYSLTLTCNSLT